MLVDKIEHDYRNAIKQFPEYAASLFDSNHRRKAEIRIACRAVLWEKYGCAYHIVALAEAKISGSQPPTNSAIAYSIRQYYGTLKREIPEVSSQIEEAIYGFIP